MSRQACLGTVELSVYVHPAWQRQGLGRQLVEALLKRARAAADTHLVVALITAGNAASIALHRACGFTYAGTLPEVAVKFAQLWGLEYWYLKV